MIRPWITAAVLTLAPLSPVRAQQENEDVHLRNLCRQYAHYLEVGPKHPHYEEALSGIGKCDATGGAIFAELWGTMSAADTEAIGRLEYETSRFRDRSLLNELLVQVADESRTRRVRIAILSVLVSYYAPGRTLPTGAAEGRPDAEYCLLGAVTHFEARDGATPLSASDRPRILQAIHSRASGDHDSTVRAAAACAASAMGIIAPL